MSLADWRGSVKDKPETLSQAQTFDTVKGYGLAYGLCHRCAAQVAWAAQLGYERVTRQPCPSCAPLIDALPVAKLNGWRSVKGRASAPHPWGEAATLARNARLAPTGGRRLPEALGEPLVGGCRAMNGLPEVGA
ncbi:MAG: hypothetical protein L6367_03890 [Cellulomonas sp.]|nr:hypothetical protein [Cellulomonas sp.]